MIISHRHKFIFLALPKTATNTIHLLLDEYGDLIGEKDFRPTEDFPFVIPRHMRARDLKKIFDDMGWDWFEYKRFSVVRNPYDRVVSNYFYFYDPKRRERILNSKNPIKRFLVKIKDRVNPTTFRDFVLSLPQRKKVFTLTPLDDFICDDNGNFLVEDIIKLEKLKEELPNLLKELGIDVDPAKIPYSNTSKRGPYQKYYDNETKQVVKEIYAYEIQRFNYVF